LYRARQTRSIELFVNWASHEDFAFRSSACWGMGQTQDPRFLPVLVKCIRDSDATVRSRALRSFSIIRSHINALKQQPISVHIGHASILENGVRAISASLRCSGGSPIPILCPLAFSLEENGVPVTRYELTRAMPDYTGTIGLVLPLTTDLATPFRDAACAALRRALDEKRPSEAWSAVCYSHGDTHGPSIPPLLQTSPGQLQKGMELANRSYLSGAIPAIETVLSILPQGPRALVIVGNENPESTSIVFHRNAHLDRLLTLLRNQDIAVYAIALPGCTPLFRSMLESLCSQTAGRLVEAANPQQLETLLIETLATAHCEYKIRYWGFEENFSPRSVHLTVTTPSSFGETDASLAGDSR
ncbi:MAG: HEAT repeat domain-containing protein, partial [Bryobacterales bacterium]|nr:HEAT repeat domain-containing protein [Bryobacterales bacterium]